MGWWIAGMFKHRRRTPEPAPEPPKAEPEEDPQARHDRELAETAAESARWLADVIRRDGVFFPSDVRGDLDADGEPASRFGRRRFFNWKE